MANVYFNFSGGGTWGEPALDVPAISGKKFHTGYYFALVPVNTKKLSAAINATTATLPISGSTATYSSTGGVVWVDDERITYTGKTSTSLTGCTRGTNATAAVSHVINSYVKFYRFDQKINSNYSIALSEVSSHVGLRGVLARYPWRAIETAQGVYDFTELDSILADMTAIGKRLCFMVELRSVASEEYMVPDYVINHVDSDTGQFQFKGVNNPDANGWYPRLWNTYTKNRFYRVSASVRCTFRRSR